MRAFLLFLLMLLNVPLVQAQKYKRTLRGEVRIPGHPPQYYYIYYIANGPNIGGYSVTQSDNGDLKAALMGRLSDDGQELYLRETQSMDEDPPGMTLCFFAARLKLTTSPGKRVWSGPFSSRQADGTPCEGGIMTFVDLDPTPPPPPKPVAAKPPVATRPPAPKPKSKPVVFKLPRPKPDSALKPALPRPVPKPLDTVVPSRPKRRKIAALPFASLPRTASPKPVLTIKGPIPVVLPKRAARPPRTMPDTGDARNAYAVETDTVRVEIWDGVESDGDMISVYYDGRALLLNEKLGTEKKVLLLPVSEDRWSTLSVHLLSEGTIPENTVALTLKEGTVAKMLSIKGSNGQVANLFFRKTEK